MHERKGKPSGAGGTEPAGEREGLESLGAGALRVQVHRARRVTGGSALLDRERWLGQKGSRGSVREGWGCGVGGRGARQGAGPKRPRPPHLGSGSRIFLLARAAGVALLFSMAIR